MDKEINTNKRTKTKPNQTKQYPPPQQQPRMKKKHPNKTERTKIVSDFRSKRKQQKYIMISLQQKHHTTKIRDWQKNLFESQNNLATYLDIWDMTQFFLRAVPQNRIYSLIIQHNFYLNYITHTHTTNICASATQSNTSTCVGSMNSLPPQKNHFECRRHKTMMETRVNSGVSWVSVVGLDTKKKKRHGGGG